MPFQPDPRDTPLCPQCAKGRGRPVAVEAHDKKTKVTFQCDACQKTWTDERRSGDLPHRYMRDRVA
jgi:hypothetical protein